MADAGVMRIRVVADTTQAEREIERTGEKIEKVQKRVDSTTGLVESTNKLGQASISAAMTGVQAAGMYRYRKQIMKAAKGGLLAKAVGIGGTGGASASGLGRVAMMASNLNPVLKLGATLVVLSGLMKNRNKTAEKSTEATNSLTRQLGYMREATRLHTAEVAKVTQESMRTREGLKGAQVARRAAADPLRRGLAYQRQRMEQMGTLISGFQSMQYTALQVSKQELDEQRKARDRYVGQMYAPYKAMGNKLLQWGVGVQTKVGESATQPTQAGLWLRTIGMALPWIGKYVAADTLARFQPAQSEGFASGNIAALNAQQASDALFRLQMRGPAATTAGIPTVRPGTAAGHTFRVRQEREELQREATRVWQDRILALMEILVKEGAMDSESLARTELQFNRPVTVGVE